MDGFEKWVDKKTLIGAGIGLVAIGGLLFWVTSGERKRRATLAGVEPAGGKFVARRAKDGKTTIVSAAVAQELLQRPGGTPPSDWLVAWWVPPSHARSATSAKWWVEQGWIFPVWEWGGGATGKRGLRPIDGLAAIARLARDKERSWTIRRRRACW